MFQNSSFVTVTGGTFNSVHGNLTSITNNYAEGAVAKFQRWLGAPDPSVNHNNARKKFHKMTGLWLLEDGRLSQWAESENSFLWINGISGSGKTIICSTIIESLKDLVQNDPGTALAYFYFDVADQAKQTEEDLLSSLLLTLSAKSGKYHVLEKLHEKHNQLHKPTVSELLAALVELVKDFQRAYIIIDALDECSQCHDVISVITSIGMPHVHVLVTSRREIHILDMLEEHVTVEVILSEDVVGHDIELYIHETIKNTQHFKRWGQELQQEIIDTLVSGAGGMFRWAACQIEELKQCRSFKALKMSLGNLPATLEITYDRILHRISKADTFNAMLLLHWLVLGMRPLTVQELAYAVAFDCETMCFDAGLALVYPDDVIEICSSLVVWSSDDTISFAHASVKEYFMKKPRMLGSRELRLCSTQSAHTLITQCCLLYLVQVDPHVILERLDIAFAKYTAEFWPNHYQLSSRGTDLKQLLETLLKPDSEQLLNWVKLYDIEDQKPNPERQKPAFPLYYAAILGLPEVVEMLVKYGNINTRGGHYGNPLQASSYMGHTEVVKILLDHGAYVDAYGGIYGSPLLNSSYGGHVGIVKLLLSHGADVEIKEEDYGTALQGASGDGSIELVQLLLDHDADVNAWSGQYGNALQIASYAGHIDVVKLLLDNGADVNASCGRYDYALIAASYAGRVEVAELLLDTGADINSRGGIYGNPLLDASAMGHIGVVKLLVDRGADINAQSEQHGNALQVASAHDHMGVVKLLLAEGMDVNGQCGKYGNALQAASSMGYLSVVALLLDNGADVNAQGGHYGSAIQAASYAGHLGVVKTLLDRGLDVNIQGGHFGNALQAASSQGQLDIVKLLLDHGADVNAKSGFFNTALQAASYKGHTRIVKLLLDHGGNVYVQGGKYNNAFEAASIHHHEDIVKMLQNYSLEEDNGSECTSFDSDEDSFHSFDD